MKHKSVMIVIIVLFVLVSGIYYLAESDEDSYDYTIRKADDVEISEVHENIEDLSTKIDMSEDHEIDLAGVYICGAVRNEGVYYVNSNARVIEALDMAGGLLDEASTTHVNLARLIEDGEIIYFPTVNEVTNNLIVEVDDGLVNINTADLNELMSLPGIGEAKALAIIDYRTQNNGFKSIEEIKKVNGIKDALFNTINEMISI